MLYNVAMLHLPMPSPLQMPVGDATLNFDGSFKPCNSDDAAWWEFRTMIPSGPRRGAISFWAIITSVSISLGQSYRLSFTTTMFSSDRLFEASIRKSNVPKAAFMSGGSSSVLTFSSFNLRPRTSLPLPNKLQKSTPAYPLS